MAAGGERCARNVSHGDCAIPARDGISKMDPGPARRVPRKAGDITPKGEREFSNCTFVRTDRDRQCGKSRPRPPSCPYPCLWL